MPLLPRGRRHCLHPHYPVTSAADAYRSAIPRAAATSRDRSSAGLTTSTSAPALRTEVHPALSRFPGGWALITDNVSAPRLAQTWTPATGDGHITLPAVAATARSRSATVIDVGAMTAEQAM